MNKTLRQKPNLTDESIINWSAVSKLLTGNKENLRENRVPKKHQEEVNQLLYYISCWKDSKKLINPEDFREKISKLDLLSVILDE